MKYIYLLLLILSSFCLKAQSPSPEIINQFYDAVFADRTAEALKLISSGKFPATAEPKTKILPLQAAIWQNNLLLVRTLIEGGAKINPKDLSLVQVAAEKGFLSIVRYLVEKGAGVNPLPNGTFSAAASSPNYDCAKYLLLHGANPKLGEVSSRLDYFLKAVKKQDYQVIDLLKLPKAELDYNNCEGQTALIVAVKAKDLKMVQYLLKKGVSKNKRETFDCGDVEYFGSTPLQIAKKLKNQSIVALLK